MMEYDCENKIFEDVRQEMTFDLHNSRNVIISGIYDFMHNADFWDQPMTERVGLMADMVAVCDDSSLESILRCYINGITKNEQHVMDEVIEFANRIKSSGRCGALDAVLSSLPAYKDAIAKDKHMEAACRYEPKRVLPPPKIKHNPVRGKNIIR